MYRMKLIVWLGNPGKQYQNTRHNIWFRILDFFVDQEKIWEFIYNNKWKSEIIQWDYLDEKIICLKPMEFMNRSGGPIDQIMNFYKIDPQNLLVIHDDIDLPTSKIQLRLGWSSAGHNWLKDIIEKIWTKDFWRIRIGVDRPVNQADVADYVLDNFKNDEINLIENKMDDIKKLIEDFIKNTNLLLLSK